jgi:hypothetical protein
MSNNLSNDDILSYLSRQNEGSGSEFELSDEFDESDSDISQSVSSIHTSGEALSTGTSSSSNDIVWKEVVNSEKIKLQNRSFRTFREGSRVKFSGLSEVETFMKFFPEDVFSHVAKQTNVYASQCLDITYDLPKRSRLNRWNDIEELHVKAFVAVQIGMGLVDKPTEE